jgi:quercetin dioxygenase-like cupin family protein
MTPQTKALCRVADGEIFDTSWGGIVWSASGQIGNSTTMTFGRATIRAGQSNPRHRHPNCDEILHVLAGRIEHTLGEERCTMEFGDTISIPKGVWHQARALEGADAVIAICFDSPDRLTEVQE